MRFKICCSSTSKYNTFIENYKGLIDKYSISVEYTDDFIDSFWQENEEGEDRYFVAHAEISDIQTLISFCVDCGGRIVILKDEDEFILEVYDYYRE